MDNLRVEDGHTSHVDQIMQLVLVGTLLFISFVAICVAFFGRRLSNEQLQNIIAEDRRMRQARERRRISRQQRKEFIEKTLVVKHVIRDPSESEEDNEDDGQQQFIQVILPCHDTYDGANAVSPPPSTNNTHATHTTKTVRRLKSNLILSKADDAEATRDSTREPWICAICLSPYEIGDEICWSPNPECVHVFHHECIEHWLYKHEDCPMCRAEYICPGTESTSVASTSQGGVQVVNDQANFVDMSGVERYWDLENPYGAAEQVGVESDNNVLSPGR